MTRSQIDYILTLAQLKNFGKAAEACFVTQSTLSALVAKFEEQSGVVLFNRKTRPISITPSGEKVLRSLRSVSREFQLLDETINEIKGYEVGNLSIACIPTVAPYLYPLILYKISDEFPEVNFSIHEYTTEKVIEEILSGHIDLGIVSTPLEHSELLEYDLYYEDFLVYDCAEDFKPSQYQVSDIDLDRLWLMEEGHCLRNQVGKICELRQQKKINGNITYSCGTILTLVEMVKINKGVTLLPRLAVESRNQIEADRIHTLSGISPTRKIGIVTHRNYTKQRILSQLIKIIQGVIGDHLPKSIPQDSFLKPF